MKTIALITAAGYGKRMGQPKQFLELGGRPMLERTLSVFEQTKVVDEIILVVNQEDIEQAKRFEFSKLKQVVAGGKERRDSVFNGLKALTDDCEIVAIHDGARPFVVPEIIEKSVAEARQCGAVVVGVPVKDTIKKVNGQLSLPAGGRGMVKETVNRGDLWQAQTPQVFKKNTIVNAYQRKDEYKVTDDAMLVEKLGIPVKMLMGSYTNIKITTPEDLRLAEGILKGEGI